MQPISIITNKIKNHPWLFSVLPVLLAVIFIYLPDLKNGFVWDDVYSFFSNPMYRDPANIYKALTGALIYQQNYFRPLPVLSFLIQIHVFDMSAARMHLVSVMLHLFNTSMVMLVTAKYLNEGNRRRVYFTSAFVGLVYGLHPAMIEPVSFISSRFDMMLTSFLLAALFADVRIRNQWWRASVVGVLFLLAALCKEMALGFALALPFFHLFRSNPEKLSFREFLKTSQSNGNLKVYLALLISGLVYLFLRYKALGVIYSASYDTSGIKLSILQHVALIGASIYKYLSLIFFPLGKLNVAHPIPTSLDLGNIITIAGYGVVLLVFVLGWFSKRNRIHIIAGAFVVLASLFPVLGIIPLPRNPGMYFAESFLPFPLAISIVVLSTPVNAVFDPVHETSSKVVVLVRSIFVAWLLLAAFTVWSTIPIWNNNISLWLWAKSANPGTVQVSDNLSSAYLVAKRYHDAVEEAEAGTKLEATDDAAWNNLALGLNGLGEYEDAIAAAQKAIRLNPGQIRNRITLARIYYFSKNYKAALAEAGSILRQDPGDVSSLVLKANIYKDTGFLSEARETMLIAVRQLPAGEERDILQAWVVDLGNEK